MFITDMPHAAFTASGVGLGAVHRALGAPWICATTSLRGPFRQKCHSCAWRSRGTRSSLR
eukprot:339997-Pyramimonas_sp.AAC.1